MDEVDRRIVTHLQRDGRLSYARLGQLVGLSDGAVRQRVTRLDAGGLIDIVAVTDPARLGFGYQALLGLKVSGDARTVAVELGQLDEAVYVVLTAGRYDLLVEVVCRGTTSFMELVNGSIRSTAGVDSVEAFTYLDITKQVYDWGVA